MRQLILVAAALACLAGEPAGQATQTVDPVQALLGRIEAVLLEGPPERYLDLLSTLADRNAAASFATAVVVPGLTRVVIRERDRVALAGTLPGEGYRLLVEVLRESGQRATVTTWRLDVRRRGADVSDWGIVSQEVLTTLQGLYRLSLNTRRQFAARDLVVSAEDLKLAVPEATVFVAETEGGPTAYVILGRGEMTFSPTPATERSQLRLVVGSEVLRSHFEVLFVRVHPSTAGARVSAREMIERPVDPRDLKRGDEVFRQESVKSYGLDLGDLSADSWSLLPQPGDLLAEIRTRRFDTLTYTRSNDEVEDISLFDRRLRRNMSVYSSQEHLKRYSRSYSEDAGADYLVRSYDVSVAYNPTRSTFDGQTRLAIETVAASTNTLKIRLADSLAVESVVSPELGRLLSVRVRNQHTVVVNLPTTVIKGYRLELVVSYSGTLEPQEIDREASSVSAPQIQDQPPTEEEIPLEESYLFSNRSYWYAQALTLGYSPARISVTVPQPWSAVASGEFESVAPPAGPVPRGQRLREFSFVARQPVRYLTLLVGRFSEPRVETISLKRLDEPLLASRRPGVYYDEVTLRVQTNPRQRARGKDVVRTTANILRFYTSLIGDFPFSALTVAVIERRLPGGHSPPYLSIVAVPGPGSSLRWADDPAALPNFPDFFAAHELAHQWWGQAIGWKNYHEHWLSEGFAQYFAALWAQQSLGPGVFNAIIRSMQQWSVQESDQGPVSLGYRIGHFKGDSRLFRAVVYNKGAMVLHMLRRLVGDEAFFAGLRRYYNTWRFAKAGTDDFRRAVEAESGIYLGRFFEHWVYGDGLPQVAFTSRLETRDGTSEAVLRFEQTGEVYDFAVTVTFEYPDGTMTSTLVKVTDRVVETRVPVKGRPRRIDANRDLATLGVFR
jgi:hypothetical protein